MNWVTIKNAIQDWVATATGLTVIWADQNAPRPAYPYGLLNLTVEDSFGRDENRYTYNAGGGTGADMEVAIVGNRLFTINCQVLNAQAGSSALAHNATAQHYLSILRTSLGKRSVLDALHADGGVAYHRREGMVRLDEVVNGRFISRASMDVFFGAVENATDTATTYINTTEISGEFDGTKTPGALDFTDEVFGGT